MKWFALIGLILFLGVAVAPSINADMKEPDIGTISIDTINEIELQQQKLLKLAESYITYYERTYGQLPKSDCDCEEQETTEWTFYVLCALIYPIVLFAFFLVAIQLILFRTIITGYLYVIMENLATELNCPYI